MTTLRDKILMLLGLPTPTELSLWQDKAVDAQIKYDAAQAEVAYLKGMLDERYESEWKITKDGTRRYRKVATKVLVNAWVTESEPIEPEHGQLHGTNTVVMEVDWSTLEDDASPDYGDHPWDQTEEYHKNCM
jgi:hypothetical protein